MGPTDDTPLLPGDWESVEEERARVQRERDRAQRERREQAQQIQNEELVQEFEEWLHESEYEADEVAASMGTVRELLRLKSEKLDSPDPRVWTHQLMAELVTEIFPRERPDGLDDPKVAASDLLLFVRFLAATRRWRNRLRDDEATLLLVPLAYPSPEDWGPGIPLDPRE